MTNKSVDHNSNRMNYYSSMENKLIDHNSSSKVLWSIIKTALNNNIIISNTYFL